MITAVAWEGNADGQTSRRLQRFLSCVKITASSNEMGCRPQSSVYKPTMYSVLKCVSSFFFPKYFRVLQTWEVEIKATLPFRDYEPPWQQLSNFKYLLGS